MSLAVSRRCLAKWGTRARRRRDSTHRVTEGASRPGRGRVQGQVVEELEVGVEHESGLTTVGQVSVELPLGRRRFVGNVLKRKIG